MDTLSNQFTYVIFDVSELSTIDFNLVEQTSAETCRLSIDRLQTLVKWTGSPPACVVALTTRGPYLAQDEILVIMTTPTWTDPNPLM